MTTMTIRPAMPGDDAAVTRLLARSYGTLLKPDYDAELLARVLPIIGRARPQLLRCPTYFVAEEAGQIMAAGGWSEAAPGGGDAAGVGHVRHVACDPDQVGRGIAGRLMREVLATAGAQGVRLLCCLSTRTAAPFYARFGFEGAAEVDVRLAPGLFLPSVEMRCRLT